MMFVKDPQLPKGGNEMYGISLEVKRNACGVRFGPGGPAREDAVKREMNLILTHLGQIFFILQKIAPAKTARLQILHGRLIDHACLGGGERHLVIVSDGRHIVKGDGTVDKIGGGNGVGEVTLGKILPVVEEIQQQGRGKPGLQAVRRSPEWNSCG